jgi:hypothetical protein
MRLCNPAHTMDSRDSSRAEASLIEIISSYALSKTKALLGKLTHIIAL